jgi:shikimate dehydrogenase
MPRLAVLGHPVAHSRSPAMQNAALAALGLGAEWHYEALDVVPEDFAQCVREMPGEGFVGANVTVPHKQLALAVADAPSEMAREIGAANTLVFAADEIQAHNTDAAGLIASLPVSPQGRRALVLGAGGAARAAIWALGAAGAEVHVWNRTEARARAVQVELSEQSIRIDVILDNAVEEIDQAAFELIVNTTAVGLRGEDPFEHLPLKRDGFGPGQAVVDMVYGDTPSSLLAAAAAAGAVVVDGIEVLVQQGALSLQVWTGREPPLDVMRTAAYSLGDR